jgi:hypothetical protein
MTDPVRGDLAFIVFAVLFREGDAMSLPDSCAGSRRAITMIHRRDRSKHTHVDLTNLLPLCASTGQPESPLTIYAHC